MALQQVVTHVTEDVQTIQKIAVPQTGQKQFNDRRVALTQELQLVVRLLLSLACKF